jgi:hypothetical protein
VVARRLREGRTASLASRQVDTSSTRERVAHEALERQGELFFETLQFCSQYLRRHAA